MPPKLKSKSSRQNSSSAKTKASLPSATNGSSTGKKRRAAETEEKKKRDEEFSNVKLDMASDEEAEQEDDKDNEEEDSAQLPFVFGSDEEDDENYSDHGDSEEDEDDEEEEFESDEEEEDEEDEEEEEDEDEENYSNENGIDEANSDEVSTEVIPEGYVPSFAKPGYLRKVRPEIEGGYASDSSTEETTNTVGNIPMEWYDDYPHIGYDINGKKVMRPAKGDELEKFLANMDDPDSWRTVPDNLEQRDVKLTEEELDIIRRIQMSEFPDANYDPYEPTVEWFTSKTEVMPLTAKPEPKSRFVPSKWEDKRIMKIVRAIREGRIVPGRKAQQKPRFYNLWTDNDTPRQDHVMHLPAPKMKLPEHDESYNPPAEYLPTDAERAEWNAMDPQDRPKNYLPQKFKNLRSVPAYARFIQERFERCLDLYMAPRVRKHRLQIDPESLIPKLPSLKDLQPFPSQLSITYKGHGGRVRSISVDPTGLWIVSGSDDGTVRMWEVTTGRCVRTWQMGGVVQAVAWGTNRDVCVFAVAVDEQVFLISPPKVSDPLKQEYTDQFVRAGYANMPDDSKSHAKWLRPSAAQEEEGYRVIVQVPRTIKQITWHRKGDYFATVSPDASNMSQAVLIHQITKHKSQSPFRKTKGLVQRVSFHPVKPHFFVATQRYVRVYDLMRQQLIKTLQPGVKWISSVDVHPQGDNVIIGTYDKRLCWFDLDLSAKPYKTLYYHTQAIRSVSFHKRYPLFASSSDDGTVHLFHGMVYGDLMQNPLIVPVKALRAHSRVEGLGVLGVEFHPTQAWIFSCGADGLIKLWT
ncbi:uncharacterized protein VTP21DRAFT_4031 [Calcarisporiella thermophila]|uniref:uncharacterized protein n=1 Tax=Calcarisporiella thermophila TaxID=911321 RepID=UPI003742A132